jgi:D-xylose transport system substrate-binding protein
MRAVGLVGVVAALLAGCSAGTPPPAAPKVGAILPTAATAQHWEDVDGPMLQRFLRIEGLEPDVRNVDGDGPALAAVAKEMIDAGARALVVATPDQAGMTAVVDAAKAREVPVVDYDLHGPDSPADYSLAWDYRAIGDLQGRGVVRGVRSTEHAAIVELEQAPTPAALDQLVAGQDNVLRPRFDSGSYRLAGSERLSGDAAATAGPALLKLMAAHGGRVDGVLGQRQLAGKVTVTGLGATPDALRAILRGDQFMTVYTPVETQTSQAAAVAGALARGDRADADRRAPVTGAHSRAVPLPPVAVTLFNIKSVFDSGVASSDEVCTDDLALRCNQLSIS